MQAVSLQDATIVEHASWTAMAFGLFVSGVSSKNRADSAKRTAHAEVSSFWTQQQIQATHDSS